LAARDPAARPPSANAVIRDLNKTAGKRFSVETHEKTSEKPRHATVQKTRFLGRDDELADLEGIVTRATLERGSQQDHDDPVLVVVSGEAGTGKSRLLRELKARFHGKPVAFVEARATEGA